MNALWYRMCQLEAEPELLLLNTGTGGSEISFLSRPDAGRPSCRGCRLEEVLNEASQPRRTLETGLRRGVGDQC